jgi:hypothetical protein
LRIHSRPPHFALNGSNGWTHNLGTREFDDDTAICRSQHDCREQRWLLKKEPKHYLVSMKCSAVILLTVALCVPPSSIAAGRPRKIPCKTEANEKSCYWTHGRLMAHMGTPAFRLWKIGTHRMLAIYSGTSVDFAVDDLGDNEHPEFPSNIQRVFRPTKNGILRTSKCVRWSLRSPTSCKRLASRAQRISSSKTTTSNGCIKRSLALTSKGATNGWRKWTEREPA